MSSDHPSSDTETITDLSDTEQVPSPDPEPSIRPPPKPDPQSVQELNALRQRCRMLQEQCDRMNEAIREQEKSRAMLATRLNTEERRNSELTSGIDEEHQHSRALISEIQARKRENQEISQKCQRLTQEREELARERAELIDRLRQVEQQVAETQVSTARDMGGVELLAHRREVEALLKEREHIKRQLQEERQRFNVERQTLVHRHEEQIKSIMNDNETRSYQSAHSAAGQSERTADPTPQDVNGWDAGNKKTVNLWKDDCRQFSYVYSKMMSSYRSINQNLTLVILIISIIQTTTQSVNATVDADTDSGKRTGIILGYINLVLTAITLFCSGYLKVYTIAETVETLKGFVERVESFLASIVFELTLAVGKRKDGNEFINQHKGTFLSILRDAPKVDGKVYKKEIEKYTKRADEFRELLVHVDQMAVDKV